MDKKYPDLEQWVNSRNTINYTLKHGLSKKSSSVLNKKATTLYNNRKGNKNFITTPHKISHLCIFNPFSNIFIQLEQLFFKNGLKTLPPHMLFLQCDFPTIPPRAEIHAQDMCRRLMAKDSRKTETK